MNPPIRSRVLRGAGVILVAANLVACEDPGEPLARGTSPCGLVSPPLLLGAADRVLTDVVLEVQLKGIVMKVLVDDPNGSGDFAGVMQEMEVFQDPACRTQALLARNQIAAVGTPVTFGTVVRAEYHPDLYNEIASAIAWPVGITFVDSAGQGVAARVRARVVDHRDDY